MKGGGRLRILIISNLFPTARRPRDARVIKQRIDAHRWLSIAARETEMLRQVAGRSIRRADQISDFNLVYTEHARRNLLAEGLHPRRILLTGSPMREVLDTGGIIMTGLDPRDVVEGVAVAMASRPAAGGSAR